VCCVPCRTVDLGSLAMTVQDVAALVKAQIAAARADADADADRLDAALAVLTGAAGLDNMVRWCGAH
jgi:hypothetical protein